MISWLLVCGSARASIFALDAATFDGFTIHSQFTAADTLNAAGGYDIQSILGTVSNGAITYAITGLEVNPNQPAMAISASGKYLFDNVFFAGPMPFDVGGVLFRFGSPGYEGNLYQFGTGLAFATTAPALGGSSSWNNERAIEVVTVTTVPEPAALSMMVAGLGLMGFVTARRRAR